MWVPRLKTLSVLTVRGKHGCGQRNGTGREFGKVNGWFQPSGTGSLPETIKLIVVLREI